MGLERGERSVFFAVNNWIAALSKCVFKCWDRTAPGVCLPAKVPSPPPDPPIPLFSLPPSVAPLLHSNRPDKGYPLQSPSHSSAATD